MDHLYWILQALAPACAAVVLLGVAKRLFDVVTPYSVSVQLMERDNPAVGVLLIGYLLGVVAIISGGALRMRSGDSVIAISLHVLGGIALLLVAGWANDRFVLRALDNTPEIVDRRNISVGAVMGGTFMGSGLLIGAIISQPLSWPNQLLLYLVGQAGLLLYAHTWQRFAGFDEGVDIGENQNLAVGIAYGGNLVGLALVLVRSVRMATKHEIWPYGLLAAVAFGIFGGLLIPLAQILYDRLILRRVRLIEEITRQRNTNAGLVEATLAIAVGAILLVCF